MIAKVCFNILIYGINYEAVKTGIIYFLHQQLTDVSKSPSALKGINRWSKRQLQFIYAESLDRPVRSEGTMSQALPSNA